MSEDRPPFWMRVMGGPIPLVMFLGFDFREDWGRARAGETWECLMVQWFRRGWLIPWRKRR